MERPYHETSKLLKRDFCPVNKYILGPFFAEFCCWEEIYCFIMVFNYIFSTEIEC